MQKISVIIPAFNCAATVEASVLSVLHGNDDAVFEVVIVDDKSTDDTLSTLRKLSRVFNKIKVICHRENLGGAAARNTAIENCIDGYIYCLDSDNMLMPGSLSYLINFAIENDADVAAFRELHYFSGSEINVSHLWRFPVGQFSFSDYVAGMIVPGASGNYLFRKSAWKDVGGYRNGSGALDSWVFGLDLVANGKKMYVADFGFYLHRYGLSSYWVRESRGKNIGALATLLIDKYLDQFESESQSRIRDSGGRWFDKIDCEPLKLLSFNIGRAGVSVNRTIARRIRYFISQIISILRVR